MLVHNNLNSYGNTKVFTHISEVKGLNSQDKCLNFIKVGIGAGL